MTFYARNALLEMVAPDQRGAGTYTTGWYKVEVGKPIAFLAGVGEIVSTGTVDLSIEQATDSAGTGAKALFTGTQITDTGDNTAKTAEAELADLDTGNSFAWVRGKAVTAGANVDLCMFVWRVYDVPLQAYEVNASVVTEAL